MARPDKQRAKSRRVELLAELGGKCAWCGTEDNLEFDCIIPQGDRHHRLDTARRMTFYWNQHALKNVQILCRPHNTAKAIIDAEYLAAIAAAKQQAQQDVVPF